MKRYPLLFLFSLILFSCGRQTKNIVSSLGVNDTQMIEIIMSNENKLYNRHDYIQDIEVIPLESSGRIMVGRIDGAIITDEHIIIYDRHMAKNVFIFGRDGKHRATINRQGRGPQEYFDLDHVALLPDKKVIAVNDSNSGKVLFFSLDGKFISSKASNFWFTKMEYLDDNNVLCGTYGWGDADPGLAEYDNRSDLLWLADNDFIVKNSSMPMRYKNRDLIINPVIRKFGDKVFVYRPYGDTIYQATNKELKALYRIEMKEIGGTANPEPNITREDIISLESRKAFLSGFFAENDDYFSFSVSTPPDGSVTDYLYSKKTGKIYVFDNDCWNDEDILCRFLPLHRTSTGGKFISVIDAHFIAAEKEKAIKHHPELAGLTDDSNPVVILYSFKEGL